jgi:hypothetical protein
MVATTGPPTAAPCELTPSELPTTLAPWEYPTRTNRWSGHACAWLDTWLTRARLPVVTDDGLVLAG